MAISRKCEHMRTTMIYCSILGCFPWQLMFKEKTFLQKAYVLYSRLMFGFYLFYVFRVYINLYVILNGETVKMDDVSSNMCVTLICTITVFRQLLIRFSSTLQNIVKLIIHREKRIVSTEDTEVLDIYYDCAKNTSKKIIFYHFLMVVLTMQYIIGPLITGPTERQVGNETIIIKPMPLPTWFPFDEQLYYLPTFIWQIVDSFVASFFVVCSDSLMFSLIVYPTGQLRMLQHSLRNFEVYKKKYNHLEDGDKAAYLAFVDLIKSHKEIIEYINCFNDTTASLNLFDFLQSSLQIAFVVTQASGKEITILLIAVMLTFFISMIQRSVLYYYYANDVIILSENLASSVWESNWYEQPRAVKFMILIFIMKTQKALTFNIGSFSFMSLYSFIAILKATYSYVMLMYGVN